MKRLLIANRGEIARRIIRTAHRMGVQTVAVYADVDADALHVQEATLAYALQGNLPSDTYLCIDKLLAAAQATGADAVHPGYGFLSENPDFAQAVQDACLSWVGPSPASIRLLGSKASAKRLAIAAGVPCLPGFDGLDEQGQASTDVQSDERLMQEAKRIGFPLMVKAINGGGGRGMRLVHHFEELPTAIASARQEAQSAFGDASVLLERALINPRHIEVQIFGDSQGNVVHLGERDCSVQRRNQKIIEESPSPALNDTQRQHLCAAAVALAKAAHYVGAGTVEFLLADTTVPTVGATQAINNFFLMEMNTRLQVEHPVTEMRYGLDLVEWQIRVARGEALPKAQADLHACGHAIELRVCAEDEHFVPHSGTIAYFEAPQGEVRMDHAVQSGTVVSPYYDPMVGKLIVHGATRNEAIDQALQGLRNTQLLGITSNQTLLDAILGHSDFRQGQAHIGWLGTEQATLASHIAAQEATYLPLAALACQALGMPTNGSTRLACAFPVQGVLQHRGVRWPYIMTPLAGGDLQLEWHDAAPVPPGTQQRAIARILTRQAKGPSTLQIRVALDGVQHTVHVHAEGATLRQLHLHNSCFWISDQTHCAQAQDEGNGHAALRSPMNGKILAVLVAEGATVKKGDTLVVLESMKLEHRLQAARDGVVARVAAEVGAQAGTGQLLVELST